MDFSRAPFTTLLVLAIIALSYSAPLWPLDTSGGASPRSLAAPPPTGEVMDHVVGRWRIFPGSVDQTAPLPAVSSSVGNQSLHAVVVIHSTGSAELPSNSSAFYIDIQQDAKRSLSASTSGLYAIRHRHGIIDTGAGPAVAQMADLLLAAGTLQGGSSWAAATQRYRHTDVGIVDSLYKGMPNSRRQFAAFPQPLTFSNDDVNTYSSLARTHVSLVYDSQSNVAVPFPTTPTMDNVMSTAPVIGVAFAQQLATEQFCPGSGKADQSNCVVGVRFINTTVLVRGNTKPHTSPVGGVASNSSATISRLLQYVLSFMSSMLSVFFLFPLQFIRASLMSQSPGELFLSIGLLIGSASSLEVALGSRRFLSLLLLTLLVGLVCYSASILIVTLGAWLRMAAYAIRKGADSRGGGLSFSKSVVLGALQKTFTNGDCVEYVAALDAFMCLPTSSRDRTEVPASLVSDLLISSDASLFRHIFSSIFEWLAATFTTIIVDPLSVAQIQVSTVQGGSTSGSLSVGDDGSRRSIGALFSFFTISTVGPSVSMADSPKITVFVGQWAGDGSGFPLVGVHASALTFRWSFLPSIVPLALILHLTYRRITLGVALRPRPLNSVDRSETTRGPLKGSRAFATFAARHTQRTSRTGLHGDGGFHVENEGTELASVETNATTAARPHRLLGDEGLSRRSPGSFPSSSGGEEKSFAAAGLAESIRLPSSNRSDAAASACPRQHQTAWWSRSLLPLPPSRTVYCGAVRRYRLFGMFTFADASKNNGGVHPLFSTTSEISLHHQQRTEAESGRSPPAAIPAATRREEAATGPHNGDEYLFTEFQDIPDGSPSVAGEDFNTGIRSVPRPGRHFSLLNQQQDPALQVPSQANPSSSASAAGTQAPVSDDELFEHAGVPYRPFFEMFVSSTFSNSVACDLMAVHLLWLTGRATDNTAFSGSIVGPLITPRLLMVLWGVLMISHLLCSSRFAVSIRGSLSRDYQRKDAATAAVGDVEFEGEDPVRLSIVQVGGVNDSASGPGVVDDHDDDDDRDLDALLTGTDDKHIKEECHHEGSVNPERQSWRRLHFLQQWERRVWTQLCKLRSRRVNHQYTRVPLDVTQNHSHGTGNAAPERGSFDASHDKHETTVELNMFLSIRLQSLALHQLPDGSASICVPNPALGVHVVDASIIRALIILLVNTFVPRRLRGLLHRPVRAFSRRRGLLRDVQLFARLQFYTMASRALRSFRFALDTSRSPVPGGDANGGAQQQPQQMPPLRPLFNAMHTDWVIALRTMDTRAEGLLLHVNSQVNSLTEILSGTAREVDTASDTQSHRRALSGLGSISAAITAPQRFFGGEGPPPAPSPLHYPHGEGRYRDGLASTVVFSAQEPTPHALTAVNGVRQATSLSPPTGTPFAPRLRPHPPPNNARREPETTTNTETASIAQDVPRASRTTNRGGDDATTAAHVQALGAMGIDESRAREALAAGGNTVEGAMAIIFGL